MASGQGALSSIGSTLSSVANSEYVASGLKNLQNSSVLMNASDSIKRTTGMDIRKAIGGKTAVEIAEERLRKDQQTNFGKSSYTGGY